jgi:NAD(P)-dependent dehydrogenase (short-subunit alcohol dehydrogenase family)
VKKNIIITGSQGSLGKFLYKNLIKKNKVLGISRFKTSRSLSSDLSNFSSVVDAFKVIKKNIPKIDAIIITTGDSNANKSYSEDQKFLYSFKKNFLTVSNVIESYSKVFNKKSTKIIVISSIAGCSIINAPVEYSVSKSAVNHYCKIMAKKLAKHKILINIISPGNILMTNNNWGIKIMKNKKKVKSYVKKNVPLNEFCKPKQILSLILHLVNENGNFATGSNFIIDGGQSL